MQPQTKKYVADVAIFAISQVAFYFAFKYILASMDPNKGKKKEAKMKSDKVLGRLGVRLGFFPTFSNGKEKRSSNESIVMEFWDRIVYTRAELRLESFENGKKIRWKSIVFIKG